ncbi:hypothetical protein Pmani_031443 [Petrolisthes manimaculis]|uniref:Uncharacterized protein n=1 Tax=Petrolisthes manimaculis TaxID=1843537 RepID=A0AAE1NTQ9_9EUCA|nr:hypothetical protein Pmani_031443 [Petrolisthes manimaculis]
MEGNGLSATRDQSASSWVALEALGVVVLSVRKTRPKEDRRLVGGQIQNRRQEMTEDGGGGRGCGWVAGEGRAGQGRAGQDRRVYGWSGEEGAKAGDRVVW